jgi:8-oxo-dGTP diphosphatase
MSGGNPFGGRLRVRVNGLIIRNEQLLLVEIASPTRNKPFWMPPGGGVKFGERLHKALVRETREETGLEVLPVHLKYVTEYLRDPYHAIEFYYSCEISGGRLEMGKDPELLADRQIIRDIRWVGLDQLNQIELYPEFLKKEPAARITDLKSDTRFIAS